MTKVTWLGEDTDGVAGPSFTTCFDRKFPKGEPVEITNPDTIKRARGSRYFKVEGDDAPAEDGSDDLKGLSIGELREMAEAREIDHTGMSKAELRDALK